MEYNLNELFKQLEDDYISISTFLEKIYINNPKLTKELIKYSIKHLNNCNKVSEIIMFAQNKNYLIQLLNDNNYFPFIIKKTNNLLNLKHYTKNNQKLQKKILKEIKNNEKKFISQILENSIKYFHLCYFHEINNNSVKLLEDILYLIIKDVADNENVQINTLEYLDCGEFSCVYKLSDKIIKIGQNRLTKKFPNNPYIVKPLLRKAFEIGENVSIFIEICENIKTECCSDEDVYTMYKKLRKLGLIWMDPKKTNIGILLKDNIIHWNKPLKPSDEALMLEQYRGTEELKTGELVLCDADCIHDEHEKNLIKQRVYTLEERYKKEKIDN